MTYALPGVPVDAPPQDRYLRSLLNVWGDLSPDVRRMVVRVVAVTVGDRIPDQPGFFRDFVTEHWPRLKETDRRVIAGASLLSKKGPRP